MTRFLEHIKSASVAELWLLVALFFIFIPHLFFQPLYISAAAFTFLMWRFLFAIHKIKLPAHSLRTIMALLAFFAIISSYQTLLGRNAGVSLLIVMLGLKLLEMQSLRDRFVAVCLGYFVTITGFLYSQSLFLGVYTLAVVFLLTTALINHNHVDNNHDKQVRHVFHGKTAATLMLQAIPLTLVLFLFFPRISGPLWTIDDSDGTAKTGLSEIMAPGQISGLSLDNSVAYRVQFKGDIPPQEKLYWRGPVFTYFDGVTWQELLSGKNVLFENRHGEQPLAIQYIEHKTSVEYTVTLEPHQRHWLFALDLPVVLPQHTYLTSNFELVATNPIKNVTRLDLRSEIDYALSANQPPLQRIFTQLPEQSGIRARQLAAQLMSSINQKSNSHSLYVELVLRYFRDNAFFYTRNPPIMLTDSVDQFLFDMQRGFCEHYASAFVVLMRAAGVPARIVTGYQGGEFNSVGNYMIVRQSDAHAWAEVWLPDQGWVRVDPTAVIPPERIMQSEIRERLSNNSNLNINNSNWTTTVKNLFAHSWDNVTYIWNQWIVGFNADKQSTLLSAIGLQNIEWQELATLLFSFLGVLIVLLSLYLIRQSRNPARPIDLIYARFCSKISKLGIEIQQSEGATSLCERVVHAYPELRQQIQTITRLYNRIRYTNTSASNTIQLLDRAVRQFKPGLTSADKQLPAKH